MKNSKNNTIFKEHRLMYRTGASLDAQTGASLDAPSTNAELAKVDSDTSSALTNAPDELKEIFPNTIPINIPNLTNLKNTYTRGDWLEINKNLFGTTTEAEGKAKAEDLQKILGVKIDGKVGPVTLTALIIKLGGFAESAETTSQIKTIEELKTKLETELTKLSIDGLTIVHDTEISSITITQTINNNKLIIREMEGVITILTVTGNSEATVSIAKTLNQAYSTTIEVYKLVATATATAAAPQAEPAPQNDVSNTLDFGTSTPNEGSKPSLAQAINEFNLLENNLKEIFKIDTTAFPARISNEIGTPKIFLYKAHDCKPGEWKIKTDGYKYQIKELLTLVKHSIISPDKSNSFSFESSGKIAINRNTETIFYKDKDGKIEENTILKDLNINRHIVLRYLRELYGKDKYSMLPVQYKDKKTNLVLSQMPNDFETNHKNYEIIDKYDEDIINIYL